MISRIVDGFAAVFLWLLAGALIACAVWEYLERDFIVALFWNGLACFPWMAANSLFDSARGIAKEEEYTYDE
jgi:uncharacterized membrane protein YraQ (UPF0718 family)